MFSAGGAQDVTLLNDKGLWVKPVQSEVGVKMSFPSVDKKIELSFYTHFLLYQSILKKSSLIFPNLVIKVQNITIVSSSPYTLYYLE